MAEVARTEFLGLPFTSLTMADAVIALRRVSRAPKWHYVVTPNAAHLARLSRWEPALLRIYANASFCFLDSRVIWLVARAIGLRPPPVVTGSDLVEHLFRRVMTAATPICVVGGDAAAMAKLRAEFSCGILSHLNPPAGFWRNEAELERIVAFVVASAADYTFLAVGSPQQELLAARIAASGRARGVGICAGASIDFLTGVQRRAPRFMQWMALEWAYRLCSDPRRLARRYLVESPTGVAFVLRGELHRRRFCGGRQPSSYTLECDSPPMTNARTEYTDNRANLS